MRHQKTRWNAGFTPNVSFIKRSLVPFASFSVSIVRGNSSTSKQTSVFLNAMKLPFSAGQVYTDTLIWVTERCRLVGTLWHATQGDEWGVRKTSVKANSDPLSGMKLMSSENVQLEDVWTCLLCLAVCLQPGQLKGCWIQVMVSVSGIVIDQVTRDYWLGDWTKAPPQYQLHKFSLFHMHTSSEDVIHAQLCQWVDPSAGEKKCIV